MKEQSGSREEWLAVFRAALAGSAHTYLSLEHSTVNGIVDAASHIADEAMIEVARRFEGEP